MEKKLSEILAGKPVFAIAFAGIALIYAILFLSLPLESIWISDEGNRILSVQAYSATSSKYLPDPFEGISGIPSGIRAYPKPYFIQENGHWRSAYQLFFPYVASFVYTAFGRAGIAALAMVAGLLSIWMAGLLARKLFSCDFRATAVMLLCAFCTPILFYSGTFLETTWAVFFAMLSAWLFFSGLGKKQETLILFGSGLTAGISILFREEGFLFAFGMFAAMAVYYFSWKRLIAFCAGAACPVFPLFIYNYLDSGSIFGMHSLVYSQLEKPELNRFVAKLIDYNFYLTLLCLPFQQLNLILPAVLLAGIFVCKLKKFRLPAEIIAYGFVILCCAAGMAGNLVMEHGGVFIYQSLLDHVPLFALCLFAAFPLFSSGGKEFRFLALVSALCIFIAPMMLNQYVLGMFWGGRHFLDIVPFLCILSVWILSSPTVEKPLKIAGYALILISLAANLSGYGVLRMKKNFSAEIVRELAKPECKVIATDVFWLPEELAWLSREKCIFLMKEPDSLEQAQKLLADNGIREFTLILGTKSRVLSNESIARAARKMDIVPGRRFHNDRLGFFELQIFRCSIRPDSK